MHRATIRLSAASLLLAVISPAFAQSACVDPTTQLVDAAKSATWSADVAKADARLMAELEGTWVGPVEDPLDTRSTLTVSYIADGTLTFALHQCGGNPADPCLDVDGTGAWTAYPATDDTFTVGRMLVAPGILEALCQSDVVTLTARPPPRTASS